MSWIDDEAGKAKLADELQARGEEAYNRQVIPLWENLQIEIQSDIEEINANAELVAQRLGGTKLRTEDCEGGFRILKTAYPAISLEIIFRYRFIQIKHVVLGERGYTLGRDLDFKLDENDQLFLVFKDAEYGSRRTPATVSQSLLEPLLRTVN